MGGKPSNAALTLAEIQRVLYNVVGTTTQASQSINSDLSVTGNVDITGDVGATGDLTFTETVTSPATSATYSIVGKSVVHTCTAAATNVIAINIPVGAKIIGAQIIVSTAMVLAGGGVTWSAAWTAAGGSLGSGLALTKNTKTKALFNANAASPIVAGAVETITITPNAGTIDVGGVLVVTAWYEELSALTDVA